MLLAENVVYTEAKRGQWLPMEKAIFQRLSGDEQNDFLLHVLLSVDLPAVTVPNHVLSAIDVYAPRQSEITPSLMRRVLRQAPSCYTNLVRKEKLLLLHYSLSDHYFADLDSLQLLPLASGKFVKFENRAKTVFIPSREHPQELFHGLADQFLDKGVHEDILRNLEAAACQGTL